MRRKWLLVLAGIVLALFIGAWAVHSHQRSQRIARGRLLDREHYGRIKVGMRQDEVEAILGGPPGDFTTRQLSFSAPVAGWPMPPGTRWERWSGDQGQIAVTFDSQGAVREDYFEGGIELPPSSLTEQVRAWLRQLGF